MFFEDDEIKEITSVLADCMSDRVLYGTVSGTLITINLNTKVAEIIMRFPSAINHMSF